MKSRRLNCMIRPLEAEPDPQLDLSREVGLSVIPENLAEIGRRYVENRVVSEDRMIEQIECFRTKLKDHVFANRRILRERYVVFAPPEVPEIAVVLRCGSQRKGGLDLEGRLLARKHVAN